MHVVRQPFFGVFRRHVDDDSRTRLCNALARMAGNGDETDRSPEVKEAHHLVACCQEWRHVPGPSPRGDGGAILILSGCPLKPTHAKDLGPDWLCSIWSSEDPLSRLSDVDGPFLMAKNIPASGTFLLVRDKFGLRPLYYWHEPGRLWFADDIRLLLALAGRPSVRTQSLVEWLYYGVPLEPRTFFDGIESLGAGRALTYNASCDTITQQRYFDPRMLVSPRHTESLAAQSAAELEAKLGNALDAAIRRGIGRASSVTVLLSGGVDSSTVAAIAARHASVTAVTVDIRGPHGESELPYAESVARHLHLAHRVCTFGPAEFRQSVCQTVHAIGTPIIIENAVALLHAAQTGAIPACQLILDGEGADALFCGSTYLFKYSMFLRTLSRLLHVSTSRTRGFVERIRKRLPYTGMDTRTVLDFGGLDVLLGARRMEMEKLTCDLIGTFSHLPDQADREISALALREFYDYLVPLMLRIDRMAAAAGTSAVMPFVDQEVFGLSVNLPMDTKLRWSWRRRQIIAKWLLKRLAGRLIPPSLVYRPKGGFAIPGGVWIGAFPQQWLQDSWLCEQFGICRDTLACWLERNAASRDRMFLITMEIWGRLFARAISLQRVCEEWLEGSQQDRVCHPAPMTTPVKQC